MTNEPIIYLCFEGEDRIKTLDMMKHFINNAAIAHSDLIIFSPVHAFSYMYARLPYDVQLRYRLAVLDICDCIITYGSNSMSDMCLDEIKYAKEHKIRVWDMKKECRLPDSEELRIRSDVA